MFLHSLFQQAQRGCQRMRIPSELKKRRYSRRSVVLGLSPADRGDSWTGTAVPPPGRPRGSAWCGDPMVNHPKVSDRVGAGMISVYTHTSSSSSWVTWVGEPRRAITSSLVQRPTPASSSCVKDRAAHPTRRRVKAINPNRRDLIISGPHSVLRTASDTRVSSSSSAALIIRMAYNTEGACSGPAHGAPWPSPCSPSQPSSPPTLARCTGRSHPRPPTLAVRRST